MPPPGAPAEGGVFFAEASGPGDPRLERDDDEIAIG
jgi:hypothetical protein